MKRILALFLSILTVFAVIPALPLTAEAEKITVAPIFGEIENYPANSDARKTYFLVSVKSGSEENHELFKKIENNECTMKVTVTDETTPKTYVIKKYYFDNPNVEFGGSEKYGSYSGGFLRLAACEYGIIPVSGHTYTIKLEFLDKSGNTVAEGCSDKGAFDKTNDDFETYGAVIPDDIPHPCENADDPYQSDAPAPLPLDANGDGRFSTKDLSAVLIHLTKEYLDFTPDYNGSGDVGIDDVTVLVQYLSSKKPFSGAYEEIAGDVRVQLYDDDLLRIEEKKDGAFCDQETLAVTGRDAFQGVSGARCVGGGKILLMTDEYTVSIPLDAKKASEVFVSGPDGKNLWKYRAGIDAVTYLPAPANTPQSWCFNDTPRVIPSAAKFDPQGTAAGENNGWIEQKDVSDFYVFLPKGDTVALREDFVALTGRCDLVPIKTLGLWFSRWYAYGEDTVLARIDEFREKGYPFDIFIVDTDWRSSEDGTGYTVNTKYFPDLARFMKAAADKNIDVLFNDHVHASDLSVLSQEQLNWFKKGITDKLKSGLSTWWYDRNWRHHVQSPFSAIHNDLIGQMMYYYFIKEYNHSVGDERTFMLSNIYWNENGIIARQPHVSTHRYSVQWTGDIGSEAKNIKNELEKMVYTGAVSAIGYFTSDIGGFLSRPDENLYIRWVQYGALSPIMRFHSSGPDRAPWAVGKKADDVAKKYITMRYRLLPLFYSLARENYTLGLPLARRLDFYYPEHDESQNNDQYLLGEDILVAPFYTSELSQKIVPAEWLKTEDGTQGGLTGKYYKGTKMEGEPVLTRVDEKIDFNWGQEAPGENVDKDYFSVKWEGTINVPGDKVIELGTLSDDGVRVYIDDQLILDNWNASDSVLTLSGTMLQPNRDYKIRIEYFDNAYDAKIQLMYIEGNRYEKEETRSVFIPDGTWIDVNTGSEYTGPKTIEVSYNVEKSPIFVKKGSVLLLAPEGTYANTANWKDMTIDLYAGDNTDDTTVLYEDDGSTEAYNATNAYRNTTFRAVCKKDGITVTVTPKVCGGYKGSFDERTYTLRIHGGNYKTLTVGGQSYDLTKTGKSDTAAPFALTGAAADGDVMTVKFTAKVNETLTLAVK